MRAQQDRFLAIYIDRDEPTRVDFRDRRRRTRQPWRASRANPVLLAAPFCVTRCNAVDNSRLISCQKVNKNADRQIATLGRVT